MSDDENRMLALAALTQHELAHALRSPSKLAEGVPGRGRFASAS